MGSRFVTRMSRCFLTGVMMVSASVASVAQVSVGQVVPVVNGPAEELVIQDNQVVYRSWAPETLSGKVRVVYHLNAKAGVDKINKPFVDAIEQLKLDTAVFSMLTVLNVSDSSYLVKRLAKSDFESKRESYVSPEFVWDEKASLRSAWGLAEEGSSITIVDTHGLVVAHKDGKLDAGEVAEFVALVQKNLVK